MAVRRYKKEFFEIKKSPIAGEGVFAKIRLKKGKNLGLAFEKINNTGIPDRDYRRMDLVAKINHSKNPNLKLLKIKNKFYLKTLRKIKNGEELFLDYYKIPWEGKRGFDFR